MGCFSWCKKKKKRKEVGSDLDEERKESKEKKKERRWWQRGFLRRFSFLSSSSASSSSSSSSSSTSSSSSSSTPSIPTLRLGPGRFALPRRCYSSPLISFSFPPPLFRSSSAPSIVSHLAPTSSPSSSSFSSPSSSFSSYNTVSCVCERPSSSGSEKDTPPSQSSTRPGAAGDLPLSSIPLERPLTVQVQSDPHVQRQGAFGRLLSVFRRSSVQQLGFPNIGNTCFMNATLQCLLSLPCFSTPIIDQQVSWTDTSSSQMLRCLAELQQARLSSSSTSMQKRHLLRAVKRCLSTRCPDFGYYAQQDAHEFLMLCLLQLKEEGEALRASSLPYICPVANFEFQLRSVRTCTSCGLQRSRVEDFNHLSINLSSTLTHSLHSYFQQTELELSCQCGKGRQACEVQEFSTLPRVLILHVKRFSMLGDGKKLKDVMDIPAQLDLSHFPGVSSLGQSNPLDLSSFRPAVESGEGQGERGQLRSSLESPPTGLYRLHGVVSHLGSSVNSGHYISDVTEGAGDSWLSFNDLKVSHETGAAILKRRATTAYLLFYVHSNAGETTLHKYEEAGESLLN